MVAEDRLTKYRVCSACEPTGTALVVNSWTTARRIACFLFSISFQHSRPESANQGTAWAEVLAAGSLWSRGRRLGRQRRRAAAVLAEVALCDPADVCAALLGVGGLRHVKTVVARVSLLAGLGRGDRNDRDRGSPGDELPGENEIPQDQQGDDRHQQRLPATHPNQAHRKSNAPEPSRVRVGSKHGQRDLVVQVEPAPGGRDPAADPLDQACALQLYELAVEAGRRDHAVGGSESEHQGLGGRLPRLQLLSIGFGRGRGCDVLAWSGDVPPPPRRGAVGRVRVGARPRAVDGPASPVRLVVPGLKTGSGPVRYLVAAKARGRALHARGVELIPLEVGVDLGHTALGAAPIEKGAFFEREAIGGH